MAATDVLTLEEGKLALGMQDVVDPALDTEVGRFITAASLWLDSVCRLPVVLRPLASLLAATEQTTLDLKDPSPLELMELEDARLAGRFVTIEGDIRAIVGVTRTELVVDEATTCAEDATVQVGLYADTASVPEDLKRACEAYLLADWGPARGVSSSEFDAYVPPLETKLVEIMAMIPNWVEPGIA